LKNNPDTDGDGLTDLEEMTLNTDPTVADSDGDGLDELDEVTFTVNPDLSRVFTNLYNPLDADADNDLRSDGVEVNSPLTIQVFGQSPYQVSSDPLVADVDLDGLVDGQEAVVGTDPTKFDTDGDNPGIGDGREGVIATNPLRKDQKVTFTVTQIQLVGTEAEDGEAGTDDTLEIDGTIRLGKSGSLADLFVLNRNDHVFYVGTIVSINISRSFILLEGETLTLQNSNFQDDDLSGPDDPFDDASQDFNFPLTTSSGKISSNGQSGGNGAVSLETSYTIGLEV